MTDPGNAHRAAAAWGVDPATPRLIKHRENAVYAVTLPGGDRAALRLHRPGYKTIAEIRSELWWMSALADRGFACPRAVTTGAGDELADLGKGAVATMVSWVEGGPIGSGEDRLAGDLAAQSRLYRKVGGMLADLHNATDALVLPEWFTRPGWDIEGLVGTTPHWGRFWENPVLTSEERRIVTAARARARSALSEYIGRAADTGLIHADALRENVFARPDGGLVLIDFDDAGPGFRLYELATALTQSLDDTAYPYLQDAICEGYAARRALDPNVERLWPLFAVLRSLAALGWVIPRLPADHPKYPTYIRRAIEGIRLWTAD